MTFEEYGTIDHGVPYVVNVERGEGALTYIGVEHVQDPEDPQLDRLRRAWEEAQPTLALYEGPAHDPPADVEAAIRSGYGEAALVRFLAKRDGVEVRSFDPDLAEQVRALVATGRSRCEVALYFVLRQVVHERRRFCGEALVSRMFEVLTFYDGVGAVEGCLESVDELDTQVRARFVGLDWRNVPEEWFDPAVTVDPQWANLVSRELSEIRDAFMVTEICKGLSSGQRVFAVAGSSHVVMQEPAVRTCAKR